MTSMQPLRPVALFLLLSLIAACGSDSAPDDSGASSAASSSEVERGSPGGASFVEDFGDACVNSSNWNRAMCECAAHKAQEELSDVARDFVLATQREDIGEIERLRPNLSVEEAAQTAMFMVHAGAECAQ